MNEERRIEAEEVTGVTPPPRARVTPETPSESFGRKRDYLTGFLAGEPKEEPAGGAGSDLQAAVVEVLKSVYDPEIPVDIYELGLIYKVDVADNKDVAVDMTLTAPNCPVAGEMPGNVKAALETVEGIGEVTVNMTFDPPWTPDRMSEEAKLELNMF